jgi:hypothetical protein
MSHKLFPEWLPNPNKTLTGVGKSNDFTKSPVRYGRVVNQSGKFGRPAIAEKNN